MRGYGRCGFHSDIFDETVEELDPEFKLKCVGGGRIRHEQAEQKILVYGYSQVRMFAIEN